MSYRFVETEEKIHVASEKKLTKASKKQQDHLKKAREVAREKARRNRQIEPVLKQLGGGAIPDVDTLTKLVNEKMDTKKEKPIDTKVIENAIEKEAERADPKLRNKISKQTLKQAKKVREDMLEKQQEEEEREEMEQRENDNVRVMNINGVDKTVVFLKNPYKLY